MEMGSSSKRSGDRKRRTRELPVTRYLAGVVAVPIAAVLAFAPSAIGDPGSDDSGVIVTSEVPVPDLGSVPVDTAPVDTGSVPAGPGGPVPDAAVPANPVPPAASQPPADLPAQGPPPAAPLPTQAPIQEPVSQPAASGTDQSTSSGDQGAATSSDSSVEQEAPPAPVTTTAVVQTPSSTKAPAASSEEPGVQGGGEQSTGGSVETAETSEPVSSPVTTTEAAADSTAQTTETSAPATGLETSEDAAPTEQSEDAGTTESSTSEAETPADESGSTEESGEPSGDSEQVSVAPTEAVIPDPPKADEESIQQVLAREPIVEEAKPATEAEAANIYSEIAAVANIREEERRGGRRDDDRDRDEWDGKVRPFDPQLIRYDDRRHRGPVICNPWKDRWLETSYWYGGQHYVRRIPPGQSLFINVDVRVQQVYGFTAVQVKVNAFGVRVVVNVSNGYFHPVGWQPPVYNNVEVHVTVNQQYYRPFPVRKVVYCGYDNVRRKDRFIFDDGYEAWGRAEWSHDRKHITRLDLEESSAYIGFRPEDAGITEGLRSDSPHAVVAQRQQVAIDHAASEDVWSKVLTVAIPSVVTGIVALAVIFGVVRPWMRRRAH